MSNRRRDRIGRIAIAACLLAIAGAGCGSEDTNGELCQRCGPNFGDCMDESTVVGDNRPSACGTSEPCVVKLTCATVIDTRVKRCYPLGTDGELDAFYRCDGERPST